MSQSRQYELVYIAAPDTSDEAMADLHTQVEAIVARFGGTIDATEQWGRRKLAYEIARQKEGIYVLELMTGSGDMVKEIDRRLKVIDHVIRHLVVRVDDEMQVVNRRKAERAAAAAKRRAARGLPPEASEGEPEEKTESDTEQAEVES